MTINGSDGSVAAVLQAEGVSKAFAGVKALQDVTLAVQAGEVLALMGENGAGKSTLLRILSGDHLPDSGALLMDGRPLALHSPRDARAARIRVIPQEPEIVRDISVAENVYIGGLPSRARRFDARALETRSAPTSSASASRAYCSPRPSAPGCHPRSDSSWRSCARW
jgi:L-arabinose transport system ATP-binding protein